MSKRCSLAVDASSQFVRDRECAECLLLISDEKRWIVGTEEREQIRPKKSKPLSCEAGESQKTQMEPSRRGWRSECSLTLIFTPI